MDNKNKFLLITSHFPPVRGGISTLIEGFASHFPSNLLVVLATEANGAERYDEKLSFKIYRGDFILDCPVLSWPIQLLRLFIILRSILKKENIEKVLIATILPAGIIGLILKIFYNISYVLFAHGRDVFYPKSFVRRCVIALILKNAEKIIANSEYTKRCILHFGIDFDKIAKVNPATDINFFMPLEDISAFKKTYGLEGKKIILTIGRLEVRKGHDMVIRTLPLIIKEIPEIIYLIIGKGDEEARLKSLVKELNVENFVYFIEDAPQENLPLFYNICDLFIMVSREIKDTGNVEGFGLVYLEANACGKPVIAGRSGGVEDAVIDGFNGLMVNPENMEEIKIAIIQLLKNKNLAFKLGNNGLKRARENFTWEKACKELYNAIKGS
jgi:phosphatidylinositol alpha-1,6-mannosyltransferase